MTWSLQLANGDLTLGRASYGSVTGSQKLVQDLRCYLLEQMGTDDAHPEFGCLLEGGVHRGEYVEGVIGLANDELTQLIIEGEIRRIVLDYQARQLARAKSDRARYRKATLTRGEILVSLSNISMVRSEDRLDVTLNLVTPENDSVVLTFGL